MDPSSIQRILVATDISVDGAGLCAFAKNLASKLGADLTVLYVVEGLPEGLLGLDLPAFGAQDTVPELEHEALAELKEHALANLDEGVGLYVTAGDPAEEILRVAAEKKADLVVLGNHGRRGLARMIYGSTVQHVIQESRFPVLAVPISS